MKKKQIILVLSFVVILGIWGLFLFINNSKIENESKDELFEVLTSDEVEDYEELNFPDNTLDTSDWKTYQNEEFGFEVRYPEEIIDISDIQVSKMKEMYEFGFYLDWTIGRVDITTQTGKIGMNIYVYDKDVDTMFDMYSNSNKAPYHTIGNIPINNTNLFFLVANKDNEDGDLFRYQRVYFAGNKERAYEIVPTQIPNEYKKIFQEIISSFKLTK